MGELFADWNRAKQAKRAASRINSADYLRQRGVSFEERNNGAHLIVGSPAGIIDFWPGTGLWIARSDNTRGRGVAKLVRKIGAKSLSTEPVEKLPGFPTNSSASNCHVEVKVV